MKTLFRYNVVVSKQCVVLVYIYMRTEIIAQINSVYAVYGFRVSATVKFRFVPPPLSLFVHALIHTYMGRDYTCKRRGWPENWIPRENANTILYIITFSTGIPGVIDFYGKTLELKIYFVFGGNRITFLWVLYFFLVDI